MGTGSRAELQSKNEHFRVTRWTIEPGGSIPLHRHEHDYVVVPLVDETMHVVNADGSEIVSALVAGQSYVRSAGAEHRIENPNADATVAFVEIERL